LPASTNAPPPKPAARKAKPGGAQRKKQAQREAKLSQQGAAAQQTDSASSVVGLNASTEKAKPLKSAASNQPQIVTALQPASKAVQSNVVPAGDGVQPPLVELETVKSTTAAEVVSTPGAVLPIKWP